MTLPHPNTDQISLPIVLGVLGDPTRLAIVRYLASKEGVPLNCSQFLDLGSKTNLSYHLAKLREAGVTRAEVVGTNRLITLRRADLDARFPGLLDSVIAAAGDDPGSARGRRPRHRSAGVELGSSPPGNGGEVPAERTERGLRRASSKKNLKSPEHRRPAPRASSPSRLRRATSPLRGGEEPKFCNIAFPGPLTTNRSSTGALACA